MAAEHQHFKIKVPEKFSDEMREAVGKEVVEFIRKRTEAGISRHGKKFVGYSDSYIESVDFKNAGKSKNNVNLTLSGDMLIALDVLSHKQGVIDIGYEENSDENAKADGNVRGTYGQKTSTGKKRDFMGIAKKDLNNIIKNVEDRFGEAEEDSGSEAISEIALAELLARIKSK